MENIKGLESISHQLDSDLVDKLITAIQKLRIHSRITQSTLTRIELREIVKKLTGLNITFIITDDVNIAVVTPELRANNPILAKAQKFYSNSDSLRLLEVNDIIDGTINLDTAKVTGQYAEVESKIFIGEALLWTSSNFTVKETVALILHEIGHIFVYLEMLSRVTRTNYILNEATLRIAKATSPIQRVRIMEEVEKVYNVSLDGKDLDSIKSKPSLFYRTIFLEMAVTESQHQLGTNIYDYGSYEHLSDVFVARHGMGKELVLGLDKLYQMYGSNVYTGPGINLTLNVIKFIGTIVLTGMLIPIPLMILIDMGNPLKRAYDKPYIRVDKIRQQLVDSLKQRSLPSDRKVEILSSIAEIDKILIRMTDNPGAWEYVYKIFIPSGRKQNKQIVLQQRLESMVNNDLFTIAAKLEGLK